MRRWVLFALLLSPTLLQATYIDKLLNKSVVLHMKERREDGKYHMGGCSGTFVAVNQILTAAHCVDADDMFVWAKDYAGIPYFCAVVKKSKDKDLALLHALIAVHDFATIGEDGKLGQVIYNVGSPYGLDFLISNGIIGKLHNSSKRFTGSYMITTAMINPGSSGGGVFDLRGRLIGVNTMTIGSPFGWTGISCAVDTKTIRDFLSN